MSDFLYLDGLNDIVGQICELAADNSHQRMHERDFMHEIQMLDVLSKRQQIALGFAGLRRFEIENEIEALEMRLINAEIDDMLRSTPWYIMAKIRIKTHIEDLLLLIPRRHNNV